MSEEVDRNEFIRPLQETIILQRECHQLDLEEERLRAQAANIQSAGAALRKAQCQSAWNLTRAWRFASGTNRRQAASPGAIQAYPACQFRNSYTASSEKMVGKSMKYS